MHDRIRTEVLVPNRKCFMFRCEESTGCRWTFLVSQTALDDLGSHQGLDAAITFSRFRGSIYAAARRRIETSTPEAQHLLSASEIRAALSAH
jgi:hypothetical protein